MWIRKPTKVITKMKTTERASRRNAILAVNPPVLNHSHKLTAYTPPGGGDDKKVIPRIRVRKAEIPTDPVPTSALTILGSLPPKMERMRNPTSGRIGINASNK